MVEHITSTGWSIFEFVYVSESETVISHNCFSQLGASLCRVGMIKSWSSNVENNFISEGVGMLLRLSSDFASFLINYQSQYQNNKLI